MRVIVLGSHRYRWKPYASAVSYDEVAWKLTEIHSATPITHMATSGIRGIEASAEYWAGRHGIKVIRCKFNYYKYGSRTHTMRNTALLKTKPHQIIIFPEASGLDDLISRMPDGFPVRLVAMDLPPPRRAKACAVV